MKPYTGRVGPKGQVVIPKSLREAHGLLPGTRVAWEELPGELLGLHRAPSALVEEMEQYALEEGLAGLTIDPHEAYESQMEARLGHLSG